MPGSDVAKWVYLDHAASTNMHPSAIEAMSHYLSDGHANPSGSHRMSRDSRKVIDEARDIVAAVIGCKPGEVIFTSGGTEGANAAVLGAVRRHGGRAVCSAAEHHAVLHCVEHVGGTVVPVTPDGTIDLTFSGSAGQSFGAFLPRGITLRLEGDSNDYVGKGLSGGRIVVRPDRSATFPAQDNVIAGNVIGYGATSGEIYLRGVVGERFCVRNSGAIAVVEGVGDHACEYMTGGRVVVLGPTGRNFGAGMSGGVAFVYDPHGQLSRVYNHEMVDLEPLGHDDRVWLRDRIMLHEHETGSTVAARLLADWTAASEQFVTVMPRDYRRVLEATERAVAEGRSVEEAVMEASHG